MTAAKSLLFDSAQLNRVWGLGFTSVGECNFGAAAYVARYHLKKRGGLGIVADDHYVDKVTGEFLKPEYVTMSRRPGLGTGWFKKFKSDVYPRDSRVIKGVDTKPCKFYDSLYEVSDPASFREVKLDRLVAASALRDDNTEERLFVKEKVKLAQISKLKTEVL